MEKGLFNSSMDSKTENSAMKSLSPTSWLSWLWRRTSEDQKQPGAGNGKPRKIWIRGTLESLDGQVCVEARGLFVVPKGMKLRGVMDGF